MKSISPRLVVQKDLRFNCESVTFSPDGALAALVPFQGSITIIDREGMTLYRPASPAEHCRNVRWSADGKALYLSPGNSTIRLVSLNGEVLNSWDCGSRVAGFDVATDGSRLVLATTDHLKCMDGDGNMLWETPLIDGGVMEVGLLASGGLLAVYWGTLIREFGPDGAAMMDYGAGGESPLAINVRGNQALLPCGSGVYLLTTGSPEARKIVPTGMDVQCAVFGPDMNRIAAGLIDGTILFAGTDGTVTETVPPESDCIQHIDWSPDGTIVLASSSDGKLRALTPRGKNVWSRPVNGSKIAGFVCEEERGLTLFKSREKLFDHFGVKKDVRDFILKQSGMFLSGAVISLDAGPGGRLAMGFDDTVSLWDRDGERLWSGQIDGSIANDVRFNPSGKIIAAGCSDGRVRLFGHKGKTLSSFSTGSISVKRIAWRPDGGLIATSYFMEKIHIDLWDTGGNHTGTIEGNGDIINAMAFFPDGRLVSAAMNGTVRIWETGGSLMDEFTEPDGFSINAISLMENGGVMAFAADGKTILWKRGERKKILKPKTGDVMAYSIQVLESDTYVTAYAQNMENTLAARTAKGELLFKRTMEGLTADIPLSLDNGGGIIYCGVKNILYRFDLNGNAMEPVRAGKTQICSLDFLPGGAIAIVAGYWDGMIDIVDGEGRVTSAVLDEVREISAVSIDPRGDRFAAASGSGTIHVWDAECRETARIDTGRQVTTIRIAPDGGHIAAGYGDGSLEIRTLQGEPVAGKEGEPFDIPVIAVWRGDGSSIAVAYASGRVVQMDTQCTVITEHRDMFCLQPAIAYDSTGRFLLYTTMDMDLIVRDAGDGGLLAAITPFEEGYIVSTPDDYYDVTDESLLGRVLFRRDGELIGADQVPGRRVKGLLDKVLSYMR